MQEDYASTLSGDSPITVPGIFYYVFDKRFGAGAVGIALSALPLVAIFNTTTLSMVTASRSAPSLFYPGLVPHLSICEASLTSAAPAVRAELASHRSGRYAVRPPFLDAAPVSLLSALTTLSSALASSAVTGGDNH